MLFFTFGCESHKVYEKNLVDKAGPAWPAFPAC
jgi:hypothetical protein